MTDIVPTRASRRLDAFGVEAPQHEDDRKALILRASAASVTKDEARL